MAEEGAEGADDRRRAELRKAGEEYFAKVLAQLKAGRDPFKAPPPPARKRDVESILDPDIREFENVLEGSRLYILSALYIASQGASWLLLKNALEALPTPALLVFLHCLPAAALLLWLHRWSGSAVDVGPLSMRSLKGSLPSVAVQSLQMLTAFRALRGGSVYLILGWTAFVPPLLQSQQRLLLQGAQLQPAQQAGVGAGVGGLALVLATGRWPGIWALLCLLAWAGVSAASLAWQLVRQQAQSGQPLAVGWLQPDQVKEVAASEDSISPAQRAFYQAAVPPLPALLLGLVCLEGRHLVDHELAVPAVSGILLSMAAWGVAQVTGLMVLERIAEAQAPPRLALDTACAAVTLALHIVVLGTGRLGGLLGAMAAVVGAALLQMPSGR